ncbi:MAG: PAS domain S-box protein [Verrucomicrobia bacterium]|nr:PAS domain S-box protein [Verrucomicrobiota bacterium]
MRKELHILIVEDVPADVVLINHELRKGGLSFRSKRVETKDDFLRELRLRPPDLILSDHGLPQFDGFAALALARAHCPDVPFLFVTGAMGEEVAIESLKGGAADYVLKGRLETLVPAVLRALRLADERRKRLEAEGALSESEEQFRMLVGGVKDYAIFMLDAGGRVTTWNAGAESIIGYSAPEVLGRHYSCIYPPDEIERGRPQEILHLAATEGRCEREARRVRKDGGRFWAHIVVSALRRPDGSLRGYAVVTRNITEQKRMAELPARLAAIVQGSDDAIISQTLDGVITSWNRAAEKLFGYTEDEAIGQPDTMVLPPERATEEAEILARIARGEGIDYFETVRVKKNGGRVNVAVTISPIRDSEDRVIGASTIARDMTEHNRAAEDLRRSEARHTAILDAALDAILSIDHLGVIQDWNSAAERMFGYTRVAALGHRIDDLIIPSALLQIYRDGLAHYLITGAGSLIGRPIELSACRADGTELAVELGITHIPGSEPPLYTAVIRDITARKQAEAEVHRLNAGLELRVRERTAELVSANEELESFSYSVSHDLRAPLRHISGFIEMLQQRTTRQLDDEGRRLVQDIADSARRMSRLIDALLDFSRLGRTELRKTRVPLGGLVQSAQAELRDELKDRKIEWIIGALPEAEVDPALMLQVLINLFSNALKFTRPRAVARLTVDVRAEPGELIGFVRDNGVGFDRRYADKLFGVFQRLHRASEFEGTGIGLATVRLIIHRHGGRTWAEGTPDGGATFYFSLPATTEEPHE